jgi:hypothetical protein
MFQKSIVVIIVEVAGPWQIRDVYAPQHVRARHGPFFENIFFEKFEKS